MTEKRCCNQILYKEGAILKQKNRLSFKILKFEKLKRTAVRSRLLDDIEQKEAQQAGDAADLET